MLAPFSKVLLTSQPKSNQPISAVVRFLPPPQFDLLPPALDLLQHLRVARPFERLLFGLAEDLRVQVIAALALGCVAKITWGRKILNVTSVQATISKRSATNLTCPRMSPFPIPSTCPFRIMFMAS